MTYQETLKHAWHLTQERKELHIFGTLSALFSILIGIPRLHYILRTDLIGWESFFDLLRKLTGSTVASGATIAVIVAFLYVGSFFIHILSEGAVISAFARQATTGEPTPRRTAWAFALRSFLQLVEFKSFTSIFSISSFAVWLFLLDFYSARYLDGVSIVRQFFPLTIFLGICIFILDIALTYAEYHLVIHRAGIMESIKRSFVLVTFYLTETLLLTILLTLIAMRTILNVLLVVFIPVLVVGVAWFFALKLSTLAAAGIALVIGLVGVWYAARISGILMIFIHAVWTLTYLELDERRVKEVSIRVGKEPEEA